MTSSNSLDSEKKFFNYEKDYEYKNQEWQNDIETWGNLNWTIDKIDKTFDTIKSSLNQTTLMLFRIWAFNPGISSEIHELKDKFDKNKQSMSWEFTSGILWEVRELLNKYWNDREKVITNELWNVLFELQQKRSERNKAKDFGNLVAEIDRHIWENVAGFIWNIDSIEWKENNISPNIKRNHWLGPFIYQWPYYW